jgi:hypothetical protein
MRQVLLVPVNHVRSSSPVLIWMDDSTHLRDEFQWQGVHWVVSAVYGTRFSDSGGAARRDKPARQEAGPAGVAHVDL